MSPSPSPSRGLNSASLTSARTRSVSGSNLAPAGSLASCFSARRAEAVKRYLYEQHQVPLHKINVISYGEEKPVAPNNTRDGRAQNRRVVIKVLA